MDICKYFPLPNGLQKATTRGFLLVGGEEQSCRPQGCSVKGRRLKFICLISVLSIKWSWVF